MNHISQKNALESRLKELKNFVPFCPNDSLPKLLFEINKIINRIEIIREMPFDKLVKEVPFQYEVRQSKSNNINFKM